MHHHQIYCCSILIYVLLIISCLASPISFRADKEYREAIHSPTPTVEMNIETIPLDATTKQNYDLSADKALNEYYYLKILCALYGSCNTFNGQQLADEDEESKQKRLSSNLFHGIPKFGKRAFASAFAGIPKFG